MTPDRPTLLETPWDALGPVVREQVIIEPYTFLLDRPSESDRLVQRIGPTEHLPYWADLWPAARMLAKWIVRQQWPSGLSAIEIGCGLGLPGIAACAKGIQVTFSDYDATALRFAAGNAKLNGFKDFDTLQIDWHHPPTDKQYPLILASDLIYDVRNVEPIVRLIELLLQPDGECLLTDQDRIPAHMLKEMLTTRGLKYTTQMLRAGEPGGRRQKGTLYRIRR